MSSISCDVCMDLIPLVQDGVASEESVSVVKEHIASCAQCRALYQERPPVEFPDRRANDRVKKKLQTFFAFLTFLGMFFGISLLVSEGVLYMTLLLPLIGACSYGVFHWKALWKMPLLLWALFLIAYVISALQGAAVHWLGVGFWILVITVFTDIGTLIVGLMHFAFRKETSS